MRSQAERGNEVGRRGVDKRGTGTERAAVPRGSCQRGRLEPVPLLPGGSAAAGPQGRGGLRNVARISKILARYGFPPLNPAERISLVAVSGA